MTYPQTKLKNYKGHLISKNDKLFVGDFIIGNHGTYLIFQVDGNLVHYDTFDSCKKEDALWSSVDQYENVDYLNLDEDGYLKIYDKNSFILNSDVLKAKTSTIFIDGHNLALAPYYGKSRRILSRADLQNSVKLQPKTETMKNKLLQESAIQFENDFKTLDKYKKLNGAIILIGSLFWDADIDKGDGKREKWREKFLVMSKDQSVPFPIRYGRVSKKDGKETYTMVVSNSATYKDTQNLGRAKLIPFTSEKSAAEQIFQLTVAEGMAKVWNMEERFLKVFGGITKPWSVIGYSINKNRNSKEISDFKSDMGKIWSRQIKENRCIEIYPKDVTVNGVIQNKDKIKNDYGDSEIEFIPFNKDGSMNFLAEDFWDTDPAKNYDYVVCTLAFPDPKYISFEKIAEKATTLCNQANSCDPRDYFNNTHKNGIHTLADDVILAFNIRSMGDNDYGSATINETGNFELGDSNDL